MVNVKTMNFLKKIYIFWTERRAFNTFIDGDYEKSLSLFLKLQSIYPEKPGIEYNLGLVELALNHFTEAENYLLSALEKDNSFQVLMSLADMYYLSGKRTKALLKYQLIVDDASDERTKLIIQRRINTCKKEEQYQETIKSWKLLEEGIELESSGDINSAARLYQQAFAADNTNFIAANNYGTYCMNSQKDYKQAQEYFRHADKLVFHPVIKDNLKKLKKLLEI